MFKFFTKHVIVLKAALDGHFLIDSQIEVLVIFLIPSKELILVVFVLVWVLLDQLQRVKPFLHEPLVSALHRNEPRLVHHLELLLILVVLVDWAELGDFNPARSIP